jgi:Fe2+ transport system protein FeoA
MSPNRGKDVVMLTLARAGQLVCVSAVDGSHGTGNRLAHLGLMSGHLVRMIRPSRHGPVVVEVKGSRLALGHGLARQIMVRLVEGTPTGVKRSLGAQIAPDVCSDRMAIPAE